MTSKEYCGDCGSFDLVKTRSGWLSRCVFGLGTSSVYCFGCNRRCSEMDFARNAVRTVPLTVDDFFFQTNLNNLGLMKYQIKPFTRVLSYCLIVSAIIALFLIKPSGDLHRLSFQRIEWASISDYAAEAKGTKLVESLQSKFEQLVKVK